MNIHDKNKKKKNFKREQISRTKRFLLKKISSPRFFLGIIGEHEH